jgi:hypothetical protein
VADYFHAFAAYWMFTMNCPLRAASSPSLTTKHSML